MRKSNINTITVFGRIYSFGESNGRNMLEVRTTGAKSKNPGTEYISGVINVATDDEGMNVVPVHFTYVTKNYSSGKENGNFTTLKKIIDEGKTWVDAGKDGATKIKIDGALGLNDWWTKEGDNDRLVSTKVNEGSFIEIVNTLPDENELDRASFKADMLITRINHIEADGEKIKEDYAVLGGAIFNFRNEILPIEFIVRNPQGIGYFESLGLEEEPFFTKVWGKINCSTIVNKIVEESAFGEASVRTFERKVREWIVKGCLQSGYEYGEEDVLTANDIQAAMADREVKLAEAKKRSEEAKRTVSASVAPTVSAGKFNF